ncbi:MAG: ester cyclase [Dehalococcoidia bacterium]
MSIEENKAVVRRFIEQALNQADMAVADQVLAETAVDRDLLIYHQPGTGPAGIKEGIQLLHVAFPDLNAEIEELLAEEDRVVARLTISGTNTGPYRGLPQPTGKHGDMRAIFIFRVDDGRIAEIRGVADRMHLLTQLGILPDIG